jgi:hypothetical protein
MIIGPPPKFHGTRDILVEGRGEQFAGEFELPTHPGASAFEQSLISHSPSAEPFRVGLFRKEREDDLAAVTDGSGPPATVHGADSGSDPAASEPGLAGSVNREQQLDAAATRSVPSGFVCGASRANTRGTGPADSWSAGPAPVLTGSPAPACGSRSPTGSGTGPVRLVRQLSRSRQ